MDRPSEPTLWHKLLSRMVNPPTQKLHYDKASVPNIARTGRPMSWTESRSCPGGGAPHKVTGRGAERLSLRHRQQPDGDNLRSMNQAKFDALDGYTTKPPSNDAERVALDFVTQLPSPRRNEFDTLSIPANWVRMRRRLIPTNNPYSTNWIWSPTSRTYTKRT